MIVDINIIKNFINDNKKNIHKVSILKKNVC